MVGLGRDLRGALGAHSAAREKIGDQRAIVPCCCETPNTANIKPRDTAKMHLNGKLVMASLIIIVFKFTPR